MNAAIPNARIVETARPLQWLARGWRDFLAVGWPSVAHGIAVTAGGWVILAITLVFWPLLPGAFSGFVLIAPILATGLYELSRLRGLGRPAAFSGAVAAWRRGTRPLVQLGLLLLAAATAWVLLSALMFGLFVNERFATPAEFLRYVLVSQGDGLFMLWLVLGGLGSAVVFSLTAVSVPLLLDRDVALRPALLASVRAVGDNPVAMALWAGIILAATLLSLATGLLGFIVTIPLIGHATWHAYLDLVDTDGLPLRR